MYVQSNNINLWLFNTSLIMPIYGGKDNIALLRHSQIVIMVPYVTYSCMGLSQITIKYIFFF